MSQQFYSGYSAYVWQAVYAGLAYFNNQLAAVSTASGATATNLATLASQAEGMYTSLRSGVIAIDAYAASQAWTAEVNSLEQIQALPLSLSGTDITNFNNRVSAYSAAASGITALVPAAPYNQPTIIDNGDSIIPEIDMLVWGSNFNAETPPAGLTSANLVTNAYAIATSMLNVANAILVYQGANLTQLYDVAYRQYQCAQSIANLINSFTSGPLATDITTVDTWNQLVTLPTLMLDADVLSGAGYTYQLQQQAVLRYAMISTANDVSTLLLSLRQPLTSKVNLTTLLVGETLFDVAARALGNYELWPEIATLNGLVPPYTGGTAASGIATWGQQLVLPTPGTDISAIGTLPSYTANFLGNDKYVGPINGSMPAWAGDFQIIGGYTNLQWALGRRLQTVLGNLKFHPNYGCRIPPEVGNIQSNTTIGHINAYGISAIRSDPRVASVTAATSTLNVYGNVAFAAKVLPGGFSSTPIGLNEVISPVP